MKTTLAALALIILSLSSAQAEEDAAFDGPATSVVQIVEAPEEYVTVSSPLPIVMPPLSSDDEAFLKKMPLRKRIGQMFMIGFQGQTLTDEGLGETIKAVAPGGIILFGRNIKSSNQLVDLLRGAQATAMNVSRLPLLTGIDQEGGNVIRLKTPVPLPSALALGKSLNPALAESAGLATGQLLKAFGFNTNFAPVLDVADPTQPSFIGTRTFGSDPETVAKMGTSFSRGLASAGVFPVVKHFPGHGGVSEDSHEGTPKKNVSLNDLRRLDLVPFARMQQNFHSRYGVMLAHIAYPKIDPSGSPATLSRRIVEGVLRQEMRYDGLVITDDIEMAGAYQVRDVRERVLRTIEAGTDMVMVAWNKKLQRELIGTVEKAVKSGRISPDRIELSVRRVILAKRTYAQPTKQPPTTKQLAAAIQNPQFAAIGEELLNSRFSKAPDAQEREFKRYATDKPVLVFSANVRFAEMFKSVLKDRKVRTFGMDVERSFDVNKVMLSNPQAIGVFYVSGYQAARIAGQISEDVARRMLLVTVEIPSAVKNAASFRYMVDAYYRHPQLGKMIAKQYFQKAQPPNTPVKKPEFRQPASSKRPKVVSSVTARDE